MNKKKTLSLFVVIIFTLAIITPSLKAKTFTLKPIADTEIRKNAPDKNFSASTKLWSINHSKDSRNSYLVFKLPAKISKVTSANFIAHYNSKGGSPWVSVYLLGIKDNNDWNPDKISEQSLTWENAPHKNPFPDLTKTVTEPGIIKISSGVPHYKTSGWNPLSTRTAKQKAIMVDFINQAISKGKKYVTFMIYIHPRGKQVGSVIYKSRESTQPPTLVLSTGAKAQEKKEFKNGSFEDGVAHWKQWWVTGKDSGKLELDETIGRNGKRCAKIVMNNKKGSRLALYQTVDINPKNVYELSFSFFTSFAKNVNANVRINALDKNGKHIGYYCKKKLSLTANIWVDHNLTFIPPADARRIMLEFNFRGPIECWLDHVKFVSLDPAMQAKMQALNNITNPLFKKLLIPGTAPAKPRIFPYWGYNASVDMFRPTALRYGWQYSEEEQYKELGDHNLAPFSLQWSKKKYIEHYSVPTTYYLPQYKRFECWGEKVIAKGAQKTGRFINFNDPVLVKYYLDCITNGCYKDTPSSTFYFVHDELYKELWSIPKKANRKSKYWQTADDVVREKYGFGKYGIPDSKGDINPFKRIAYARWQAALIVETFTKFRTKLKESSPQTLLIGPDELSTFCPLDWERLGQVIDIQPGQTLSGSSGQRRFLVGYLVKYYRDLTKKPVYPFIQFVKYGASPSIETVYDWANQTLRNGGSGMFLGGVEWFDREINHPKYAAPKKWAAMLNIVDIMQRLETVRTPSDKSMALHSSSYTQMSRGKKHDGEKLGSACAMLGPRTQAWYTFTDDFQVDRNVKLWDVYKTVVLPDAKYISYNMITAALRFVKNGGTLIVTDPQAFSFAIDGVDISTFRTEIFGVTRNKPKIQAYIKINGKQLSNPDSEKALALNIVNPKTTKALALFADGTPAVVEHLIGKGRVWFFAYQGFTDESADDMEWIDQWRTWLTKANVSLDHDIWRFKLPQKKILLGEQKDKCLTGNAIRFRRNFPEVSMNIELPGSYSYAIAPINIPEKITNKMIIFQKGLLTNRRKLLNLKRKSNNTVVDVKQNAIQNWVVRFGADETEPNSITIDLSKKCKLNQIRLVFSGTLPKTIITVSNDRIKWIRVGALAERNAGKDVLVAEKNISGSYRYIRLNLAKRKPDTSLTLAEMEVWGTK